MGSYQRRVLRQSPTSIKNFVKKFYNRYQTTKIKAMGVYDDDILDYLKSRENKTCHFEELWERVKHKPDITQAWLINDINNLEKDGLLTFNKETGMLVLSSKATKPVVKLPPDSRR